MNHVEHYHDWLRDAHAMEKQAESMLESMASRIDNYPDLRARIEQHVNETKHQITVLEEILDRNDISRSVIKRFHEQNGGARPVHWRHVPFRRNC